jgi:long-chain acyl-CoA synthetase
MPTKATLTVAETMPKSFVLSCKTRGDRPAMREKLYGIWNAISWTQWLERSRSITFALHEIGFRPGDVASVLANTVPEWNYADFGILCAGGVSSGIYPTDSAKQVEYLVNDSKTSVLFVEDDEQLDKALDVRERCPTLRKIVVFDMEGLRTFDDPMVVSLDEFMASGRNYGQGKDALFEELVASRKPTTSPSWSTPRAPRARPRGRCTATATWSTDAELHASRSVALVVRGRRAAGLPAALPCRRAHRRQLPVVATGVCMQLRREPGDGARTISARCSPPLSAPCRASGRSSIPASRSR